MKRGELHGYLYVLVAATLWGVSSVVAKSLFNLGLPPSELILIRLTLTTMILFLLLLCFDRSRLAVSLRDLPYFLILGLIGVGGMQFTYYYAISKIHVGLAILLQYLQPIWVSLYAFLFQKEPLSKGKIASLLLSIGGCYFVVGGYEVALLRSNGAGILIGFAGSLFFAFYALYGEKGLRKYDPWTVILYALGFAAFFNCILTPPAKVLGGGHSFKLWMAFLFIAIFSGLIPYGLYFKGMERIRATRASIAATWEPVIAGLTAYLVLGEVLSPLQVLGGMSVIAAIFVLQLSRERAAPSTPLELRRKG